MKKRFFYEFKGNVYLEADDQDAAEELIMGISLVDFLIDEDLFEIDEHYVPVDLEKREEKNDTILHPLVDESNDYHGKKQSYPPLNSISSRFFDTIPARVSSLLENGSNSTKAVLPAKDCVILDIKPSCCEPVNKKSPIRPSASTRL